MSAAKLRLGRQTFGLKVGWSSEVSPIGLLPKRLDQRRRAHHVALARSAPGGCFGVEPPMLDVPVLVDMRRVPCGLACRSRRPRTPAPAAPSR